MWLETPDETLFSRAVFPVVLFESPAELVTWAWYPGSGGRCPERFLMSQAPRAPDVSELCLVS